MSTALDAARHKLPVLSRLLVSNELAPFMKRWLLRVPPAKFRNSVWRACVMSVVGGHVNAVCVAGLFHCGVTHLTGQVTRLGTAVVSTLLVLQQQHLRGVFYAQVLLWYVCGCTVAGLVLGRRRDHWRHPQAVLVSLQCAVMWAAYAVVLLATRGTAAAAAAAETTTAPYYNVGAYLLALSSGMQNAGTGTANTTGIVTDIGMSLGQALKGGVGPHRRKLLLWVPCFLCFWGGALLGTACYLWLGKHALAVAAGMVSAGVVYSWVWCWLKWERWQLLGVGRGKEGTEGKVKDEDEDEDEDQAQEEEQQHPGGEIKGEMRCLLPPREHGLGHRLRDTVGWRNRWRNRSGSLQEQRNEDVEMVAPSEVVDSGMVLATDGVTTWDGPLLWEQLHGQHSPGDLHLDEEQLSRVVNSEFWEEHSRAGFQVSDSATITASRASRPRRRSAPPGHPPRRNSLQQGSEFSYGALWEGPTSCGEAESTEHANANECDSGGDPPAPATSEEQVRDDGVRFCGLPLGREFRFVVCASLLGGVGGYLSGMTTTGVFGYGLTHMTGMTTDSAMGLVHPSFASQPWWLYTLIVLCFVLGGFVAGLVVEAGPHHWGKRQATVITLEMALLWAAWILLDTHVKLAALCVTTAAGLQNGSTGNLPSLALRTCNVTGFVVEMGMSMGLLLRERLRCSVATARLWLWTPLFFTFFVGSMVGSVVYLQLGPSFSLALGAAIVSLVAALSWLWWLFRVCRKECSRRRQQYHKSVAINMDANDGSSVRGEGRSMLPRLDGHVAAVVNSPDEQADELAAVLRDRNQVLHRAAQQALEEAVQEERQVERMLEKMRGEKRQRKAKKI